jgi:ABC-2 type transport system permease protein
MTNVPPLLRRELNAYFASVLGYVALMFFLLVMGVTFAVVVRYLNTGPTQMTAMKILFSMFWLPSLVVVPMITMRLLAEEKRAGTLEMLMTAHFSGSETMLDLGPIFSGYLGVIVIGQFFIAVGLLASSMTKSQVAAALMSFAVVFLMLIVLNWLTFLFPTGPLGKVFHAVSAFDQMEDFERGIVDVRPVVLYLSGTVLALFITTRVVESRKWR